MELQNKNTSGLTLLELMIATAVLVVALCGLLAVFTGLFSLNENSRKLTLAITSVQNKIEEMRNADFDTLYDTYNEAPFNPDNFPSSDAKGSVFIDNTDPDLLKVYVSVSWKERSNKIVGEDTNLNGILDNDEDIDNPDGRLNSPAEIVTLIGRR